MCFLFDALGAQRQIPTPKQNSLPTPNPELPGAWELGLVRIGSWELLALVDELPHHVRKDAAVAERHQFFRRVDARRDGELGRLAVGRRADDADVAARL